MTTIKNKTAISRYSRSYKVEIIDKKDVIVQLKDSEISLKDFFKDLSAELKGIKHQLTLCAMLSKQKSRNEIEYRTVYFNSLTKTVISESNYFLDDCFNEIIYKVENWISHGSGWNVDNILNEYLNISSYKPSFGHTYCKLPKELQHPMKDLINIKNNDNKCFLWCFVRLLNCLGKDLSRRISKKDKEISESLNYNGIAFPLSKKDNGKIGVMNKINIQNFCCEKVIFPIYLSDQNFDDVLD